MKKICKGDQWMWHKPHLGSGGTYRSTLQFRIPGFLGLAMILIFLCSMLQGISGEDRLYYRAAYVDKPADRTWNLQFVGEVPSLAGCYLVVHDTEGRAVFVGHVPHGEYRKEAPFVATIPKSGSKEQYRILIVGRQSDVMGADLPLTDLDKEVYGGTNFATRSKNLLWFQPAVDIPEKSITGYSGPLDVLSKDGTTPAKKPLKAGSLYALKIVKTFYFNIEPEAFLAFSSDRLFQPDEKLAAVPWWQLAFQKIPDGSEGR